MSNLKKLYCPLTVIQGAWEECKAEKCAWWSPRAVRCSIAVLPDLVEIIEYKKGE